MEIHDVNNVTILIVSFRLRKNLKCLIIAHPTWFIRTVLAISRPFIRYIFNTSAV